MELKIEYVPIDSIKPYSKNAKLHPAEQIEQIKKSIQEFGFKDPLATWHGEVMAGNGRLQAAKELGMKELPIVRLDDLTDEQRRAYALVHNKLTMNSPFDDGILSEELENILDIDMSSFDFDIGENEEDFEPSFVDDYNDNYNIIIQCNDLEEAKELCEKLGVNLDLTRQKIACKYKDIDL